ncbi:MAG: hypothetical protein A2629_00120 [Candidatus Levybacteria bacterium RIFCSPHIGHO2_01_FULL_41_15]|nr:MAG: hypothetical protein A2629_00120 [Candidatus Levybacteria bacterium RIFCSPHIGHO2_01_FULL_41_15]
MDKNTAVIVPSYRESEKNIKALVLKIKNILPDSLTIIIDDSPKKEAHKIKSLLKNYKNVKIIFRFKKLGRGSAVMEGFKEAFKNKNIKYFFEIDSDLAHNPSQMPRFLNKIMTGKCDVVIGSRYIEGGKTINIVLSRIILSRIINLFLRFWLNIKLSDFTGGFRMYNRKSTEFLCKSKIRSNGFITLSETLFLLDKNGFRVTEVPITVSVKKEGKSNVDIKELFRSLFFVLSIRFNRFIN